MDWGVVAAIITALAAGLAAVVGARVTARGQRETAETSGRADEWQKLFDELKEFNEQRLDAVRDDLGGRIESLRMDVDVLSVKLGDSLSLNRTLLGIVDDPDSIDIPSSIVADLR